MEHFHDQRPILQQELETARARVAELEARLANPEIPSSILHPSHNGEHKHDPAIHVSEERFRLLVESVEDYAIYIIDPLGHIMSWNNGAERLKGYHTQEILGQHFSRFFTEEDRKVAKPQKLLDAARSAGRLQEEGWRVRKDAARFWATVTLTALWNEDGSLYGFAKITRDMTATKRAEVALRQSEERYRSLILATSNIVWRTDADGQAIETIAQWEEFSGLSNDSVWTGSWLNSIHPEDRGQATALWSQAVGNQTFYEAEFRMRRHDGQWRNMLAKGTPLRTEDGDIYEWVGTCADITDRKQAELKLRESEIRFRRAVEEAPFPIMIHAEDGDVLALSRAWTELSGYTLSDIPTVGDWLGKAYGSDLDRVQAHVATLYHLGTARTEGEYTITVKDGSQRIWNFSSTGLGRGPDGRRMVISMAADITDRKAIEAEIQRVNAELEQRVTERTAMLESKNRELDMFTYSVSHDLKAPLRGIDGYSRLLLEDYLDQLDEDGRTFLHNIRGATRQMGTLIDDLLAYSRVDRREMHIGPMNLQSLITALIAEYETDIQARNASVTLNTLCHTVTADPEGLTIAVRNLLDNALKFTSNVPHPLIEIGGLETETACILSVRDNGIGFDMKYHDRILEIFQRLHRIEDYPGTGIGLTIVRKAMERMGGRVWAESMPGEGATFYLEIPR